MNRTLMIAGALALMSGAMYGQSPYVGPAVAATQFVLVTSAPSGSCVGNQVAYYSGNYYGCIAGTWTQFGSGGGFVNPMTTEGDMIYGGASGAATRLGAGTSGYVLESQGSGSPLVWAPSTGGASSGTNLIQVSNGSGGFISDSDLKADLSTAGNPLLGNTPNSLYVPLQIERSGIARTSANQSVAQFTFNSSSTVAAPGTFEALGCNETLAGSDAAFTDHNPICAYLIETDNRTPTAASTVDHEMAGVFREYFNGGNNLTCNGCNGIYITAGSDFPATTPGTGGSASIMNGVQVDAGDITGYGTISAWNGADIGYPSATDGKAALGNVTGVLLGDPASVSHGTGSGCVAALAIGAHCITAAGEFALYSDTTAPITMLGSIAVGSLTPPTTGVAVDAEGEVDAGAMSGTTPSIGFRDTGAGSVRTWINNPSGAIGHLKLPSSAGTLSDEAGAYDSATAITGNLAAQTLFAPPDTNNRFFRLVVYGVCTSSVAGSTVTVNFTFTDEQQAQTVSSSAQTCAAAGDILTFTAAAYANTGTIHISTTTVNSPVYLLHARLELLGPNAINSN